MNLSSQCLLAHSFCFKIRESQNSFSWKRLYRSPGSTLCPGISPHAPQGCPSRQWGVTTLTPGPAHILTASLPRAASSWEFLEVHPEFLELRKSPCMPQFLPSLWNTAVGVPQQWTEAPHKSHPFCPHPNQTLFECLTLKHNAAF